jgi:ribonucleoside-diphosphate reductase alpha chain
MELTGIRAKVFLDRYSLKDKTGNPTEKTPEEMWRRVARGIARVEKKSVQKKWENAFYNTMKDFKFVPAGRILSGAGTNYQVTYFNCFVIPSPKDSREGILNSLSQLVEIQSRSGGVGLNLSSLRPRGARVKKVNGTSSGPIVWAGLFSYATHDVVQQGGTRRGATMIMLWDWHPDIEEFITVKQDLTKINGANLSVCISDAFMEAVKKDADWDLVYPDLDDPKYDTHWDGEIDKWRKMGGKVKIHKTVKATYLWNLICEAAWRSAEPGLHFLERSNKRSNTHYFERLIATNPCGEQPLGAWAVCNLGAMNLAAYVKNKKFDFENFAKDVKVAMRFLDNVIDETYYFFKENEKVAKEIRRTGLGIMGLADALIKMELRYGSKEAMPTIDKIFSTLRDNAYEASVEVAKEKGAFPKFDAKKYLQGYHIKALPESIRKNIKKYGIRNAVLLTIAPTGTTSLLSGVSSGVEPVYEFSFTRRDRTGEHEILHPLYEEWKENHPNEEKPFYFVSANDLTPMEHTTVQAVAQGYIDSSISKTVNAPNSHTVEDVKELYMSAYDLGLKGVTYMRDGSRMGVLERKPAKKEEKPVEIAPQEIAVKERPMVVHGSTYKIATPVGTAFITINSNAVGEPIEVFINVGKAGSDVHAMATGLGRVISLTLRFSPNLKPEDRMSELVDQLRDIGGARVMGFGKERVRSLPDAIAKVLDMHMKLNDAAQKQEESSEVKQVLSITQETLPLQEEKAAAPSKKSNFDICPSCGEAAFVFEEGCKKCYSCAYSEC